MLSDLRPTCQTCRCDIHLEDQRNHYKSEWHRYNLKRKMVNLASVDANTFLLKSLTITNDNTKKDKHCDQCAKHFASENAYQSHLSSKKHLIMVKNNLDVSKNEDVNLQSWETVPNDKSHEYTCFFCETSSSFLNVNQLISHLRNCHSFFIPFQAKLIDCEGLIEHLKIKVETFNICIWCNKHFVKTLNCKRHMKDKGHTKLFFDTENEYIFDYIQYYTKQNIKLIVQDEQKIDKLFTSIFGKTYNFMQDMVEEVDEDYLIEPTTETFQLSLPNGHTLGHRSLNIYYKQRLNPRKLMMKSYKTHKCFCNRSYSSYFLNQKKSRENNGTSHLTKYELKRDKSNFLLPHRRYNRNALMVSLRANNQKHFRQQVDF